MSASTSPITWSPERPNSEPPRLRFGAVATADGAVQWVLKRNCSITPSQLMASFGGLCVVSLGIAVFFWLQGARMVMPFAWCELLAVGTAMLVFARHAGDRESIALSAERFTVEHWHGREVQRVEFVPDWVHVEPEYAERSLIALSSRGRRIAVGRYVRPELRPMLADELRSVLRARRQAPRHGTV